MPPLTPFLRCYFCRCRCSRCHAAFDFPPWLQLPPRRFARAPAFFADFRQIYAAIFAASPSLRIILAIMIFRDEHAMRYLPMPFFMLLFSLPLLPMMPLRLPPRQFAIFSFSLPRRHCAFCLPPAFLIIAFRFRRFSPAAAAIAVFRHAQFSPFVIIFRRRCFFFFSRRYDSLSSMFAGLPLMFRFRARFRAYILPRALPPAAAAPLSPLQFMMLQLLPALDSMLICVCRCPAIADAFVARVTPCFR